MEAKAEQERGAVAGMGQALFCALGGQRGRGTCFVRGTGKGAPIQPCGVRGSASRPDLRLFSPQSSWDLPSA